MIFQSVKKSKSVSPSHQLLVAVAACIKMAQTASLLGSLLLGQRATLIGL